MVFKNIFGKKKAKKTEQEATPASAPQASSSQTKLTETTPAQPAPATAPEPAKTETETKPATGSAPEGPAAPAPVAQGEDKKPEVAPTTEVKKPTESRSYPSFSSYPNFLGELDCCEGSTTMDRLGGLAPSARSCFYDKSGFGVARSCLSVVARTH